MNWKVTVWSKGFMTQIVVYAETPEDAIAEAARHTACMYSGASVRIGVPELQGETLYITEWIRRRLCALTQIVADMNVANLEQGECLDRVAYLFEEARKTLCEYTNNAAK